MHGVRRSYPYCSTGSLVKMVSSEEIRHNFTSTPCPFVESMPRCHHWWFAQMKVFWLSKHWACSTFRAGQHLYLPCRVNCNSSAQTGQTFMNSRWPSKQCCLLTFHDCSFHGVIILRPVVKEMLGILFVPTHKGTRQSSYSLLHIQLFPVLHPFANQCTVCSTLRNPLLCIQQDLWVTHSRHS